MSTPKGWQHRATAEGDRRRGQADRLDVTEREAFLAYAEAVKERFGKVNQIYNNAGIGYIGDIEVSPFKDIERVMDVDYWAA